MQRRILSYVVVALVALAIGSTFQPFAWLPTAAQGGCQTFKETGKTLCGKFLTYWQKNGGLPQQGFPISNSFTEVSDLDGKSYTVQYFERAVFEDHPENPAPYDVLLSQLGTYRLKEKYPNGAPGGGQPVPTTPPQQSGIVGQTFDYTPFLEKTKFHLVVTDAKEADNLPKTGYWDAATAKGKFIIVLMDITNTGNEPGSFYSGDFRLKDSKGRSFDSSSDFNANLLAGEIYNAKTPGADVQPGFTDKFVMLYDVPKDATGYVLVKH